VLDEISPALHHYSGDLSLLISEGGVNVEDTREFAKMLHPPSASPSSLKDTGAPLLSTSRT
jgi:hypothetical protein